MDMEPIVSFVVFSVDRVIGSKGEGSRDRPVPSFYASFICPYIDIGGFFFS